MSTPSQNYPNQVSKNSRCVAWCSFQPDQPVSSVSVKKCVEMCPAPLAEASIQRLINENQVSPEQAGAIPVPLGNKNCKKWCSFPLGATTQKVRKCITMCPNNYSSAITGLVNNARGLQQAQNKQQFQSPDLQAIVRKAEEQQGLPVLNQSAIQSAVRAALGKTSPAVPSTIQNVKQAASQGMGINPVNATPASHGMIAEAHVLPSTTALAPQGVEENAGLQAIATAAIEATNSQNVAVPVVEPNPQQVNSSKKLIKWPSLKRNANVEQQIVPPSLQASAKPIINQNENEEKVVRAIIENIVNNQNKVGGSKTSKTNTNKQQSKVTGPKPTRERVNIGKRKAVVYKGTKGAEYIKKDGKFVSLAKFK